MMFLTILDVLKQLVKYPWVSVSSVINYVSFIQHKPQDPGLPVLLRGGLPFAELDT